MYGSLLMTVAHTTQSLQQVILEQQLVPQMQVEMDHLLIITALVYLHILDQVPQKQMPESMHI